MNWMVNLCFVLVSTTVSGSILVIVWCLIAKILEMAGKPEYILNVFQVIHLFFLIPVSMLSILWMGYRDRYHFRFFLRSTRTMIAVSGIIVLCWGIGMIWRIFAELRMLYGQSRFEKTLFFCEVGKREVFEEVCGQLGIRAGRVALWQSYGIQIPMVIGLVHPKVVLPVRDYSEYQLRVIFMHELCHYRQKDLWVKLLNHIVACIHFFNPVISVLRERVELWSEFICDFHAVQELGDTREYFKTIAELMMEDGAAEKQDSKPQKKQNKLNWRVQHMLKFNKGKKISFWKAAVMGVTTIALSGVLIFRTTAYAADLSVEAYYGTEEAREETVTRDDDVEHRTTLDNSRRAIVVNILNPNAKGLTTYQLTIPANTFVMTNSVHMPAGSSIAISGITSSTTLPLRVGIGNSIGDIRYVSAYGGFAHTFSIDYSGSYYIYFENRNSEDIDIAGSYIFNNGSNTTP